MSRGCVGNDQKLWKNHFYKVSDHSRHIPHSFSKFFLKIQFLLSKIFNIYLMIIQNFPWDPTLWKVGYKMKNSKNLLRKHILDLKFHEESEKLIKNDIFPLFEVDLGHFKWASCSVPYGLIWVKNGPINGVLTGFNVNTR